MHPNLLSRLALIACLLAPVACSGPSPEQYVARAEQELSKGNYPAAIIELKNALLEEQQDDFPRARWLLGNAYLATGDASSAEKELERAQHLDWNPNEVRPALARALAAQRKFAAVKAISTDSLEPGPTARLLATQAVAELSQGNTWEAESLLGEALETQPDDSEVQLARARLLIATGDQPGALVLVERVLATAPDNGRGWSLKGDLLYAQGQLSDAAEAFDKAIALLPYSFDDHAKRGVLNLQQANLKAAQTDADWLLKASPRHPSGNYIQGLIHFQNDRYVDAIAALSLAEPMAQYYPLTLFYLGAAKMIDGHPEEAGTFAKRLVNLLPNYVPGRKLLASIYLKTRQLEKAQQVLRPVLDAEPDNTGALDLMANALLLDGKTDQALDLLARIAQLEPGSATAHFRLGAGLMFAGQSEQAVRQMEKALQLDPQYQRADILLVFEHLQKGEFEGAIEAALAYLERNPVSVAAHSLLGRAYLAANQTEQAVAAFKQALALQPGDPAASHALAQIALAADDVATARKYYQGLLELNTDYLPALLQLALIDAREQDEVALVAHLERAQRAHPKAVEPRLMLGRYYMWKGKAALIPPLFSSLSELQQRSPQVLHLVALSQLAEHQPANARYTLEQLIKQEPDSAPAHDLLATAAAQSGDIDKAKQEWQQALALDANHLTSLIALARLAWTPHGTNEAFEEYLQRMMALAPDAGDVLRLRAAAAQRDGNTALAVELTQKAFDTVPGTDTMLELAGYKYVAGDHTGSRQLTEKWVANHPEDVTARMALASQLQHAGEIELANAQFRAVLELAPDTVAALNNLAWQLRLEQPEQALQLSKRAVTLEPDRADVLDTLAVIEHLKGNNRQAQRHLNRALAVEPDNTSLLYHRAMIENAVGDKTAARKTLDKVLGQAADFKERKDAEALLASLRQ